MKTIMIFLTFLSSVFVFEPVDESEINIIGQVEIDLYKIQYGNIIDSEGDIDGILFITDMSTNALVNTMLYENQGLEFFNYVAQTSENEFIIVCNEYYEDEENQTEPFKKTSLMKYNLNFEKVAEEILYSQYHEFHNHNHHLILVDEYGNNIYINNDLEVLDILELKTEYQSRYCDQFQGTLYINGAIKESLEIYRPGIYNIEIIDGEYDFFYSVVINPLLEVIKADDYSPVIIFGYDEIYINDTNYFEGTMISKPGRYQLKIYGDNDYTYIYDFEILPVISFRTGEVSDILYDNFSFYKPISIFSNAGKMYVDNAEYESEIINTVGYHHLVLYCDGDLSIDYDFTIYPNIYGWSGEEYYGSAKFNILGNGLLNDEPVTNEIVVDVPGEYELKLLFDGETYEVYNFTIYQDQPEKNTFEINTAISIFFMLGIIAGTYFIFRKK